MKLTIEVLCPKIDLSNHWSVPSIDSFVDILQAPSIDSFVDILNQAMLLV